MKGFKEFGVAMTGVFPVREAVTLAKSAEKNGLGSVWFAEDYFFRGGIPYIAAASLSTERIRIGLGVVNPYSRHPALIAMEFGTLDEMANKRTVFGLGAGVPFWMSQMGYTVEKPLSRTKECVELIRKIMTGESITHEGEFFKTKDVKLIFEPVRKIVPIYLAFEGKMGLELAGEIGDGVILSIFNTPSYIKFAWDRVREGAKKAGKSLDKFEMVSYIPMVIDEDVDKAIGLARNLMKLYLPHSQPGGPLMEHAGVPAELTKAMTKGVSEGKDVGDMITDKMVQTLGVVGDVESCIKYLREFIDAGANTPVVFPMPGVDLQQTMKVLSKNVIPHLR
jgi:5,10-methylenetetrahydromethanopterin reductase